MHVIPGPFTYHRPTTIEDAVALLARFGDHARTLSGGHSLIPMMKLRMATPAHLVDICAIGGLRGIAEEGDAIVIGARTTQADIINSDLLASSVPILRETALQIADPQIRARATIGGNVANGDPGNDMPAVMMCLGASYDLVGPSGARTVEARAFYRGAYDLDLAAGEIVARLRIPRPLPGHGYAYEKLKRKVGDYAMAAAAVVVTMAGDRVSHASIALTNLAPMALYAAEASQIVTGSTLDSDTIRRASVSAKSITEPSTDSKGTAEYRREMAGVMTARALSRAKTRAQGATA